MRGAGQIENRSDLLARKENEVTTETRPYGDRAVVLEVADNQNLFRERPTVVICPDCGEVVEMYQQGLPPVIPQFDSRCPDCEVTLKRWCAVAVDATCADLVTTQKLNSMVRDYWNEQFWRGITTNRGDIRNDEFVNRCGTKASEFGWDAELICPLCRDSMISLDRSTSEVPPGFDYHHWSERPDCGIMLCRDCHDIISRNECDYNVEQLAHDWGLRSRNDFQAIRLALRDAIVTGRALSPNRAEYLVNRYNLIQTPAEVRTLLRATLANSDLYDQFVDDSLWTGTN
jgi:hypothetical protein